MKYHSLEKSLVKIINSFAGFAKIIKLSRKAAETVEIQNMTIQF